MKFQKKEVGPRWQKMNDVSEPFGSKGKKNKSLDRILCNAFCPEGKPGRPDITLELFLIRKVEEAL